MIMATEAIKLVLGLGEPLVGRLMLYDSLSMQFRNVKVRKNPECDLCGENPTVTGLIDYDAFCAVDLPKPEDQVKPEEVEVSPQVLKELLESKANIRLIDVRESHEFQINRIEPGELMPLSLFDQFISKLDPSDDIYIYCYKGMRSLTALKKLKDAGFTKLHSLAGGIDAWAEQVDAEMPRY